MPTIKDTRTDLKTLNKEIDKRGLKRNYIANLLGITESSLSRKLKGKYDFTRDEIGSLAQLLNLTTKEVMDIFFDVNVQ